MTGSTLPAPQGRRVDGCENAVAHRASSSSFVGRRRMYYSDPCIMQGNARVGGTAPHPRGANKNKPHINMYVDSPMTPAKSASPACTAPLEIKQLSAA